ncbi:hemin uptake protein HemP [Acinetobacter apis]|uniref:Hemin uptake protein HemP n=1 Tax=Acinetobacter apis TaxID=1229165 RepID=A0A217EES3_9GAMM|nr:hemin uptake protein HemP [Acinetobacter apis]SNQ28995.1 Hemin uptake protein HemP [Acinetobacter apis]
MNAPFNLFTRSTSNESIQTLPMLHSNNLFALGREIRIMHAGEEYRLRLTRNNRLILTK